MTEPNLDLRLVANSILVARNDNLTARVDADIKVEGPLKSATVRGQVLTTNSRFFKNIDIIPIALPGRPAPHPQPPSVAPPTLSFPDPPLRDWKFDLTIKSKDPILIRGNLANGSAIVDMKITGTGLHPKVQGQVRLENFEATLPFSTLRSISASSISTRTIRSIHESNCRAPRRSAIIRFTFTFTGRRPRPRRFSAVSRLCPRRKSFRSWPPARRGMN